MIQLIRAYVDDRVVHAEAYDHDERVHDTRDPHERCRCMPVHLWHSRMAHLATFGGYDKVTVTSIYLSETRNI